MRSTPARPDSRSSVKRRSTVSATCSPSSPELTEPRRTVAWYLWWVGEETGYVRKEAMASRLHYMLNAFSDFDVPIALAPPTEPATPVASGTPVT